VAVINPDQVVEVAVVKERPAVSCCRQNRVIRVSTRTYARYMTTLSPINVLRLHAASMSRCVFIKEMI
jgi:hypothetical protein